VIGRTRVVLDERRLRFDDDTNVNNSRIIKTMYNAVQKDCGLLSVILDSVNVEIGN